jgi:hypothetical protein
MVSSKPAYFEATNAIITVDDDVDFEMFDVDIPVEESTNPLQVRGKIIVTCVLQYFSRIVLMRYTVYVRD